MESMRDVNRVMEREIKKGSSPLKLDHIEFGDYSYQEIMSQEKLFEVLTYFISIYRKKIWKSADIHIKGMKHTPSLCRTSILGHCIRIVWWQEKNMLLTV